MTAFRAVRGSRHPRRVASSVWLPWSAGAALLVSLAAVALVAGGRVEHGVGDRSAVLQGHQSVTSTAAQAVRRSLNEGVDDVALIAATLAQQPVTQRAQQQAQLRSVADVHNEYRSLYVVDPRGSVVAGIGSRPHPAVLPPVVTAPGLGRALNVGGSDLIAQYAPFAGPRGARRVLVAESNPAFLRLALEGVLPGSAWVVDADGRMLAAMGDVAPFEHLDRPALRRAALEASDTPGYDLTGPDPDVRAVVAWAPAAGAGSAGALGLGVVSARDLDTVTLAQTHDREQALLFGVLLLAIAVGVFGWLYAMLIRPLQRLADEAERLAHGDLTDPVQIRRYDEIGLIGRSLEDLRLVLLRQRVQQPTNGHTRSGVC